MHMYSHICLSVYIGYCQIYYRYTGKANPALNRDNSRPLGWVPSPSLRLRPLKPRCSARGGISIPRRDLKRFFTVFVQLAGPTPKSLIQGVGGWPKTLHLYQAPRRYCCWSRVPSLSSKSLNYLTQTVARLRSQNEPNTPHCQSPARHASQVETPRLRFRVSTAFHVPWPMVPSFLLSALAAQRALAGQAAGSEDANGLLGGVLSAESGASTSAFCF